MKRTDIEGLELFTLLTTIQSIVKNISSAVRRAGISKLFGTQGSINVQGEEQQNLDILANQVILCVIWILNSMNFIRKEKQLNAITGLIWDQF